MVVVMAMVACIIVDAYLIVIVNQATTVMSNKMVGEKNLLYKVTTMPKKGELVKPTTEEPTFGLVEIDVFPSILLILYFS